MTLEYVNIAVSMGVRGKEEVFLNFLKTTMWEYRGDPNIKLPDWARRIAMNWKNETAGR